ncbi:type II toxin-antitoxin system VapC family toxin [Polymorphobacter fuscus]|uniref:type II toxin-antitoxin system VapC family toxin n=1 Tax=Sandarakinorhabdus fusca TaxID=1439888 RepID=UPI001430310E|nr:type II toxin-antitoxin system VapC family toxin [Polymorphobacter fuscus]NJC07368.1 putative nucleic acid-binding protein [Polymorphobacter fuscus]
MPGDGLHVLDSSGWIEWLSGGPGAAHFGPLIAVPDQMIVPAITIYETLRWALAKADADRTQRLAVRMQLSRVVDLDVNLAVAAANFAHQGKMGMADSMIYATAQRFGAELWTQDADFEGLPGVRYFPKLSGP